MWRYHYMIKWRHHCTSVLQHTLMVLSLIITDTAQTRHVCGRPLGPLGFFIAWTRGERGTKSKCKNKTKNKTKQNKNKNKNKKKKKKIATRWAIQQYLHRRNLTLKPNTGSVFGTNKQPNWALANAITTGPLKARLLPDFYQSRVKPLGQLQAVARIFPTLSLLRCAKCWARLDLATNILRPIHYAYIGQIFAVGVFIWRHINFASHHTRDRHVCFLFARPARKIKQNDLY